MTPRSPDRRLSTARKLAYGFGDMGAALSYGTVSFFFLYYLVEAAGLSPALAGVVLLSGRIFDALLDPIIGLWSDRTRSRWGRRRPFIALGGLPFAVSFALIWALPGASEATIFALSMAAVFAHMLAFAIVTIPFAALTPELTADYDERTSLTSFRTAFAVIATLVASAAPPALVAAVNAERGLPAGARDGWAAMGAAFALLMVLSFATVVIAVREPSSLLSAPDERGLTQEYRSLLGIHGYPEVLGLFALLTAAMGVVSAMLPFYLASVVVLPPGAQSMMLALVFTAAILALPLWSALAARAGKKLALALGALLWAAGLCAQAAFAPSGAVTPILVGTGLASGLGLGSVMLFPWAMLPDVLEFDELETGRRREGLLYSLFALVQKGAYALGAFVTGQALAIAGYVRGAAEQSERALNGIRLVIGPVTLLLVLAALVVVRRYPITRRSHEQARARLAQRARSPCGGAAAPEGA